MTSQFIKRGASYRLFSRFITGKHSVSRSVSRLSSCLIGLAFSILLISCAAKQPAIAIDPGTVSPGSQVTKDGEKLSLLGDPVAVGRRLPDTALIDAKTMTPVNLNDYQDTVLFLSIVPSVDTKVCEAQTHYLGEEGDRLPKQVKRITISRDTPFAHARFAEEADLEDIQFLSDYRKGEFGRSTGLLVDGPLLLARSVILVDKDGIIQYIQVVPEITSLPDMEKAFAKAVELADLQ
jgi:thiol peroxidase